MDISVISVKRKIDFIHKFIESFSSTTFPQKKINIFVGSNDDSYLEKYKNNQLINVKKFDDKKQELIKKYSISEKMRENYIQCLNFENDVLVFEDDIIFSKGWENIFNKSIQQLNILYGENYILNFFTSKHLDVNKNLPYSFIAANLFIGGLGIYYPKKIKELFYNYIKNYNGEKAHDVLLQQFLIENKYINTFVTVPCFVQHIGVFSTWSNSNYSMRAIDFRENLE